MFMLCDSNYGWQLWDILYNSYGADLLFLCCTQKEWLTRNGPLAWVQIIVSNFTTITVNVCQHISGDLSVGKTFRTGPSANWQNKHVGNPFSAHSRYISSSSLTCKLAVIERNVKLQFNNVRCIRLHPWEQSPIVLFSFAFTTSHWHHHGVGATYFHFSLTVHNGRRK